MKLLTDENIAASVVQTLKKEGFDIKDVKEQSLQGITDKELLDIAFKENRIIITHDKDFGILFYSKRNKGIILIKPLNQKPINIIKIILSLLKSTIKNKLKNNFTILTETKAIIHKK